MSLLQGIVTKVLQNAMQDNQPRQQASEQGGLGGLLGSLAGAAMQGQSGQSQGGLGGLLGSVVSSQLGGSSRQGSGLDSVLGGLLGGQRTNASPSDLGGILGSVLGGSQQAPQINRQSGGFNKSTLLLALLPVVLAFIQKNGGLSGVLNKFNGAGLEGKAQSWVNIDTDNDGIDAADVMRLFGDHEINKLSDQTGASQTEVCQGIADLLPEVVNELTPQGSLATESEANDEIAQILRQINTPL